MSLLHEIAASGDIERLEDLLDQKNFNRDEKDDDWGGRTPLMWAVIGGHFRSVKILLEQEANPNLHNEEGKTAAHFAAESGRADILRLLIENGCDETVTDRHGSRPMDEALLYGNLQCAELLSQTMQGQINRRKRPSDWLDHFNDNKSDAGIKHLKKQRSMFLSTTYREHEERKRRRSGGSKQKR